MFFFFVIVVILIKSHVDKKQGSIGTTNPDTMVAIVAQNKCVTYTWGIKFIVYPNVSLIVF